MKTKKEDTLDEHLELTLEKIFYCDKFFIKEIIKLRMLFKLPLDGYKTFDEYFNFLEKESALVDEDKSYLHTRITLEMFVLADSEGLPYYYAYWFEGFFALGKNYKKIELRLPFGMQREFSIIGATCGLMTPDLKNGNIKLAIFPGASIRSIKSFLDKHSELINTTLEKQSRLGMFKPVRKSNKRNYDEIFERSKAGEFTSLGEWIPGRKLGPEHRPECIKNIGPERIVEIISQERKKEKIKQKIK